MRIAQKVSVNLWQRTEQGNLILFHVFNQVAELPPCLALGEAHVLAFDQLTVDNFGQDKSALKRSANAHNVLILRR